MLKKIKLSGSLGRRFGVFHEFDVDTYPEAVRALCSQVDGFKDYMCSSVGGYMKYAIFVDGKNINPTDDAQFKASREVRIIPVPTGSKNGGLMQIAIGVGIMAAAFFTGGAALAAMGTFATSAFMMGGAIALGGVMQMISPQQAGMKLEVKSTQNKASYAFGGAVNTTAAGNPIPLPYGYRTCGGAVFSSSSVAEDMI